MATTIPSNQTHVFAAVNSCTFPVNAAKFITPRDQRRPRLREHPTLTHSLEVPMNSAVVAELLGQVIPLATGS